MTDHDDEETANPLGGTTIPLGPGPIVDEGAGSHKTTLVRNLAGRIVRSELRGEAWKASTVFSHHDFPSGKHRLFYVKFGAHGLQVLQLVKYSINKK